MDQCPFCGARLLANATFCSNCGRTFDQSATQATHLTDAPTLQMEEESDETLITTPLPSDKKSIPGPITLVPIEDDEEDEEEKRRRAALLGLGAPLLGTLANQPAQPQIPMLQGTPQASNVPVIHGTPQGPAGSPTLPAPGTGSPAPRSTLLKRLLPSRRSSGHHKPPRHHRPPRHHHHHHHHHRLHHFLHATHGGVSNLVIMIAAATALILGGVLTLGATTFAPNLSLSGGSTIQSGGNLTIHGSHFIPNSSIELTLDNRPLYISGHVQPTEQAKKQVQAGATLNTLAYAWLQPGRSNVISAGGDGAFRVTIYVDPSWLVGKHTIHASESVTHRSASLSFTVARPSVTATETPTVTPTPTPTPTPAPSPTPTPTPTPAPVQPPAPIQPPVQTPPPPALSCATPGTLHLGPVATGSTHTVSKTVTLCTTGTGTLNWSSSHSSASWLTVSPGHGTIHAPSTAHVTVSASAAHLAAGTYTSTITFSGGTTQTVHVTFTIKAPLPGLSVSPTSLDANNTDQCSYNTESQLSNCTVTVTNTSSVASLNWSASGDVGATVTPQSGALGPGSSTRVTISVPLSNCIIDSLHVATFKGPANSVGVIWACPAPQLSVDQTSLSTSNPACSFEESDNAYHCTINLMNDSNFVDLNWSSITNGSGVTVRPSSGTIGVGDSGSESVTIIIPASNCNGPLFSTTITFKGPANSVDVTFRCGG